MEDNFIKELQHGFLDEAEELLDMTESAFLSLDQGDYSQERVDEIFRLAHNLKGSAAAVGFEQLSAFAHKMEDVLNVIKNGELVPDQKVCTVLLKALDILKDYVSGLRGDENYLVDSGEVEKELILVASGSGGSAPSEPAEEMKVGEILVEQNIVTEQQVEEALAEQNKTVGEILADKGAAPKEKIEKAIEKHEQSSPTRKQKKEEYIRVALSKLDNVINITGELMTQALILGNLTEGMAEQSQELRSTMRYVGKLINDIQGISLSLRMIPVRQLFQKMQRIVRDISEEQGKNIKFVMAGEYVELDRIVVDQMSDPLTHILRNSADHGIEKPDVRAQSGKPDTALVKLSAIEADGQVIILVEDDGKGIDPDVIKKKAIEKGLITRERGDSMTKDEILMLIFAPGFSTAEQVTDISGRGVGMDVVKRSVESLKGTIDLTSEVGKGTTFKITLPLSLSIIDGMMVNVSGEKFIIPVTQLVETVELQNFTIEGKGDSRILRLRDQILPVRSLSKMLNMKQTDENVGLVINSNEGKVMLTTQGVLGQQKIVIKKLSGKFEGISGIVGSCILGTGELSVILNLPELTSLK